MENLILGGGLAGLITLEMLKEQNYILFTKQVGGQLSEDFKLGPRILHYNDYTKKFMNRLNINVCPKKFRIGYIVNGIIKDRINEEEKLKYFYKTRNKNIIPNKTFLSGDKNEIIGWDMNEINLVEVLYERNKNRVFKVNIKDISLENKKVNMVNYNNLISTIDLNLFFKLTKRNNQFDLRRKNVYYSLLEKNENYKNYDYLYNITDDNIHRININKDNIVIESERGLEEKLKEFIGYHKLLKELSLESLFGVKMVGRYAQYDHNIKANNIIERFSAYEKNMCI